MRRLDSRVPMRPLGIAPGGRRGCPCQARPFDLAGGDLYDLDGRTDHVRWPILALRTFGQTRSTPYVPISIWERERGSDSLTTPIRFQIETVPVRFLRVGRRWAW